LEVIREKAGREKVKAALGAASSFKQAARPAVNK
jgi:hypothetical protein